MPLLRWINYIDRNLFKDFSGFYELPYLANNPTLMIDSVLKLPISVHNHKEQAIYTNNDVAQGVMLY
jgi:hypothetical protein